MAEVQPARRVSHRVLLGPRQRLVRAVGAGRVAAVARHGTVGVPKVHPDARGRGVTRHAPAELPQRGGARPEPRARRRGALFAGREPRFVRAGAPRGAPEQVHPPALVPQGAHSGERDQQRGDRPRRPREVGDDG